MANSAALVEAAKEVLIKRMILQPVHGRLTPDNCTIILMDYQSQFALSINSTDGDILIRNGINLAKIARTFSISTVLTTIGQSSFGGPLFSKLQEILPNQEPIDRYGLEIQYERSGLDERQTRLANDKPRERWWPNALRFRSDH
jgi:hypothetical protein